MSAACRISRQHNTESGTWQSPRFINSPRRHYRPSLGFTLLELIIILLLVSILATTAASRFFRADDVSARTQRDALLQLSRQLQQRSMQDVAGLTSTCPLLLISSTHAGLVNHCDNNPQLLADPANPAQVQWGNNQLQSSQSLPLILRFDRLGRPTGVCSSGCTFTLVQAAGSYSLCIGGSGYVRTC